MHANYSELRTKAGFRLGLARLPYSECAAVSIHIPAGSRDDPPGMAGLAHFVEHMLFKGTATRDARRISIETEDAGASLNACTTEDQTVYEARGDAATLPLLVDVLCDIVWHSSFPPNEIELEREVIAEEIIMYRESPSDHIGDLISEALWSPHPLGEPVSGSEQSIARIDRRALLDFTGLHHFREDLVITVAGPFEEHEVLELFDSRLPQPVPAPSPVTLVRDSQARRSRMLETRDTQQIQLALAYSCFGRSDPQRHALRLLGMILGEGASSRLFQILREERGLCYQIGCDTSLYADVGALEIHVGLDADSRDEALACIRSELADLADQGPGEAELLRAKRLAGSQTRAALESTATHAGWIGESLIQHDRVVTPAEALREIETVTAAEVHAVAGLVFRIENEAIAEIRPA